MYIIYFLIANLRDRFIISFYRYRTNYEMLTNLLKTVFGVWLGYNLKPDLLLELTFLKLLHYMLYFQICVSFFPISFNDVWLGA